MIIQSRNYTWTILQILTCVFLAGCSMSSSTTSIATACTHTSGQAPCNFGTNGLIASDFGLPNQWGSAIARQSDGKLIVTSALIDNSNFFDSGRVGVTRFLANGSIDTSFGTAGKFTTSVDTNNRLDSNWASGVAIQADGKIVFTVGNLALTIIRLTSAGTLDTSFATGGIFQDSNIGRANQIAIQSDSKIVVATTKITMTNGQYGVARLNTNGVLDPTFGTGGVSGFESVLMSGSNMASNYLVLQSDGKIVVAGRLISTGGAVHLGFETARLNTNGTLDNTFGVNGQVSTDFGPGYASPTALAVQSDGKIVVAGQTPGATFLATVRYLSDGSLDPGFASAGIFAMVSGAYAGSMVIESDAKILFSADSNLYRLTASGSTDTTWGTNGVRTSALTTINAMLIEPNRITLVGSDASADRALGEAMLVP